MPILIGAKGATIAGINYAPYTYVDWLSPDQEALATQGGDATSVAARGLTSAQTSAVQALVSGAGFPTAALLSVVLVGDSIMGYGDVSQSGGSTIGDTSQSHIAWASAYLCGSPLRVVANRAVGGTLIDGAAANSLIGTGATPQIPSAIGDNAAILWIHSGVNHLSPVLDASLPTQAQILAKFERLLAITAPRKHLVIVDAITPLYAGADTPSSAVARRGEIPALNAGIKTICAKYRNVVFNDIYTPLAIDQVGNANPNYVTKKNGIHFTTWGAQIAGAASAQTLRVSTIASPAYRIVKQVTMPDFSGTSGVKTAGSGTINGVVASNFELAVASGTGVVTASVANAQQSISIDNSAGGASCVVQFKLSNKTAYLGSLASGDLVSAFARIACRSQSELRRCNLSFQQNPNGTAVTVDALALPTQEFGDSGAQGVALPLYPPVFEGVFATRPFTVSAVLASVDVVVTFSVSAGGRAEFDVSGMGLDALA